MRIELHRTNISPSREGEDGVGLSHAPQFDSAVITARGKEGGLKWVVGDRPCPPAMLLYHTQSLHQLLY